MFCRQALLRLGRSPRSKDILWATKTRSRPRCHASSKQPVINLTYTGAAQTLHVKRAWPPFLAGVQSSELVPERARAGVRVCTDTPAGKHVHDGRQTRRPGRKRHDVMTASPLGIRWETMTHQVPAKAGCLAARRGPWEADLVSRPPALPPHLASCSRSLLAFRKTQLGDRRICHVQRHVSTTPEWATPWFG